MTIRSEHTKNTLKLLEKITKSKLTLGYLIWAIRQNEEMTQVEFAEKLQISKQHLCDIEHNRKTISPKLAALYAEQLGYSTEQFVRLCLQDMVDRANLDISIEATAKSKFPKYKKVIFSFA